jgi:phosphate transport system substrate-binding protein
MTRNSLAAPPVRARLAGITRIACFAVGIIAALVASAVGAEPVSLHGSTTVINMLVAPHQAEIEAASGQQIVVIGNGSQRGLADLVAGKAQIAMISALLELEVDKINAKQPGSIDLAHLRAHVVGTARVAFAIHPSNPVRRLSSDQLTDILVGKIDNWREVGGLDQPIMVVTAQSGDGMRTMVESKLPPGRTLAKDARIMTNVAQVAKIVAQVQGAIGIIAASSLNGSVAEINQDVVLTTPLILVTIGDGTPQVRRVIDAVVKLGQF